MTSRPYPTPSKQAQEQRLLEAVIALGSEAERRAFLTAIADVDMRQRLTELVAAGAEADSFFSSSPVQHAAPEAQTVTVAVPIGEAPAQVIGRYKLLEIIGEGGFGEVWMAEQREPVKRRVALKVIKLGMDSRQIVARFEAERQALAMMDHPNIAKIYDAGTTETGRPYFVMELVRGVKITEYCDQNQLPTKQRLDLFITVCQAIQHAHQKGIIHRDIKPSNILVTVNDGVAVPKVIDFGIAKATQQELTDKTVFTQFQQFIGTPAYISPEQAEMSSLDIDTRADIYSLGVLLYELLVGQTPFDAGEMMKGGLDALRKLIREKEPQRPSTRLNTLPGDARTTAGKRRQTDAVKLVHQLEGDLDWIVMKCLEKDRTRRYETANGLAADLKRHLANEPVTARPPSAGYRLQKAFRRNKLVFSAASVVVIALMVGITVSTRQTVKALKAQRETELARQGEALQRRGAEEKRAEAEAERQRANTEAVKAVESREHSRRLLYAADMNLAQQAFNQNNLGRALRLLDRHRPKPGEEDLRGWEWRYLWQAFRSDAFHQLTKRPTRCLSVSFSADGAQLAVGFQGGRIELWDVGSRSLLKEIRTNGPAPGRAAFAPSSNLLAATGERGGLTLHNLSSGQKTVLLPENGILCRELNFTPDGSRLMAFTFGRLGASAMTFDVARGSALRTNVTFGANFLTGISRLSSDNKRLYLSHMARESQALTVKCLDPGTGMELWAVDLGMDYGVSAMALSPDDKWLVTASAFASDRIRVWNAETGKQVAELAGHTGWVAELTFSRDGRWLASAAADQTLRLWDTSRWTEVRVFRGHQDEVACVAFSPDSRMLASGSKDGVILLWDISDRQSPYGHRLLPPRLSAVAEYAPGLTIATDNRGSNPVRLRLEDLSEREVQVGSDLRNPFTYLPPNHFGYYEQTNVLRIMEYRETGTEIFRETVGTNLLCQVGRITIPMLAWSGEHRLIAWSEVSGTVRVAGVGQPARRWHWNSELRRPRPMAFSPDGKLLVLRNQLSPTAIGPDGRAMRSPEQSEGPRKLEVREVSTGKLVLHSQITMIIPGDIREHKPPVAFADGGRKLVLATQPGTDMQILFWDLTQPELPPKIFHERGTVSSLSVSPDGRWIAVGSQAGIAVIYDTASMERRHELAASMQAVFSLTFSPDSRTLATGAGGRESIKLWQPATGQELLTLSSERSLLMDIAFAEDGNTLVLGRFQEPGSWQMWRAPSWEVIAEAEGKRPARSDSDGVSVKNR